jgi:hypothetical protein
MKHADTQCPNGLVTKSFGRVAGVAVWERARMLSQRAAVQHDQTEFQAL